MGTLGMVALLSAALCALTPLPNVVGHRFEVQGPPVHADAIVVLGAGLMGNGSLTFDSMQRMLSGLLLYEEGWAPLIVFTGDSQHGRLSESDLRANIAEKLGLAPEAVIGSIAVHTTRDEAQRVAAILGKRGLNRILLVTESLHMRRAKAVFEKSGLTVDPVPSDDLPDIATLPSERLALTFRLLEESTALTYYKLAGYI
jgi:uncharacterized SAM-binding protein YcdF (DUF218 family)